MNYNEKNTLRKMEIQNKSGARVDILRIFEFIFLTGVIVSFVILCLRVLFFVYDSVKKVPKVEISQLYKDGSPSIIYDADGNVVQNIYATYKDNLYVSYEDIGDNVINAFIAYLDPNYFNDQEFDFTALSEGFYNGDISEDEAMVENYGTKRSITQRLLNNQVFYVKTENTTSSILKRNLKAIAWAVQLKKRSNRNSVIEVYLNTLNFGGHTIGVREASNRYFDKEPKDLSIAEAALLVVFSIDAEKYNPLTNQDEALSMERVILHSMLVEGKISEKEYQDALGEDSFADISQNINKTQIIAQDAADGYGKALISALRRDLMTKLNFSQTEAYNAIYRGGLKIYSCQDMDLQKICDNAANDDKNYPKDVKLYIKYTMSARDKFDNITNYDEDNLLQFRKNTLKNGDEKFFRSKAEVEKLIKRFEKYIVKTKKKVEESYVAYTKEPQVSVVLIDHKTGRVKALNCGRDLKSGVDSDKIGKTLEVNDTFINRAIDYTRKPGTIFGTLSTYIPALDSCGLTVADVVDDCVDNVDKETHMLENHEYNGMTNIRDAIVNYNDVATAAFLNRIDIMTGYDYVKRLGISTIVKSEKDYDGEIITDLNNSFAVGNLIKGVSNYELTSAYAAIANEGVYNSPILYGKVTDEGGRGFIIKNSNKQTVIKKENAWLITDILSEAAKNNGNAKLKEKGVQFAGLEGRTYDKSDKWYMGYTPSFTLGIWMGNDDTSSFEDSGCTEKLWSVIMDGVNKNTGQKKASFKKPKNIITRKVCSKSGELGSKGVCDAHDINSHIYTEYFVKGTEPDSYCRSHIKYAIDKNTGLPATKDTKSADIVYEVYMVKNRNNKKSEDKTDDAKYVLKKGK